MIDRLRELLDRPIRDAERRRLFVLAVAAVLTTAVLLALTGHPAGEQRPSPATSNPPAARPSVISRPAPTPRAPQPRPRDQVAVTATARRFLNGYLAYLYGHGPASTIREASGALHRRLQRERPQVSPATRQRHGRTVGLTERRTGGGSFAVTATITDGGVARYPISLTLAHRRYGWRVVKVGAE